MANQMATVRISLLERTAHLLTLTLLTALAVIVGAAPAAADGGVSFTDLAVDPGSGLTYQRAPSRSAETLQNLRLQSLSEPLDPQLVPTTPYNTNGQPGIAIFDYDRDGDLDIYVTNGPGAANSLFSNLLAETGQATFEDLATQAGVAATEQDGMGVCFGDTDNDGDDDLLVLGRDQPNRFFENRGDGTFSEPTDSGLSGGSFSSPSCAFGDIDADGLLDLVVGNAYDHSNLLACMVEPFALTQHNQLFHNRGENRFEEISTTSGIQELIGFVPPTEGAAGITWAVSLVDLDLDGDQDIVFGDDHCAMTETIYGGDVDRGFLHILLNDGLGNFSDMPMLNTPFPSSSWMGLGFGDLNCDGNLDIFSSNVGDYMEEGLGNPYIFGQESTRPVFGFGDGSFADQGVGTVGGSVFAWGNGIFDYDNDGDQDAIYHGGLDLNVIVTADNPGVLLQNQDCSGEFVYDSAALSKDHRRRIAQALALGDLDRNGFVDMVSASSFDLPEEVPLVPSPSQWGSPFDGQGALGITWDATPEGFVWRGIDRSPGSLSVELSSGGNGNQSVNLTALGSIGLTQKGRVNRSGIGAIITFQPQDAPAVMSPVQGGSSFASQHSLELTFGLGDALRGNVEVLWPGGVRNRLYGVRAGERLALPEIPCSFDAEWSSRSEFLVCVIHSIWDLRQSNVLDSRQGWRHFHSMLRAYNETH